MRQACFAIVAVALLAAVGLGEEKQLFNGKDLSGWTGDKSLWSVEEESIVGTTNGLKYNTFLVADGEHADFVLRFECKLDGNNSGVQFRSKVVDDKKFVMSGYQADIAPNYWGLLYEEKARGMLDFAKDTKGLAKLGDWAKYEVRAQGPEITITVNGEQTVKYTEKDEQKGAKSGKIGLQLHAGPAMKVHFRNLTLEKL